MMDGRGRTVQLWLVADGCSDAVVPLIGARGYEQLGPELGNVQYIIHQLRSH
jgi:hypothetical protein